MNVDERGGNATQGRVDRTIRRTRRGTPTVPFLFFSVTFMEPNMTSVKG